MTKKLLEMKTLDFCYPGVTEKVLSNVNFTINDGDYISIVGKSGSGKSTLLSILALLNEPSAGEYLILGKDVKALTAKSIANLKNREIGVVFQNYNLLSRLSVMQNVALPLSYNPDIKRKDYQPLCLKALQRVGMAEYANANVSELSGGQQQRVAIARALINTPSLILADEPTGNLDSINSQMIYELLGELNDNGTTICFITHDKEFAQQAKRQWTISDGVLHCHSLQQARKTA